MIRNFTLVLAAGLVAGFFVACRHNPTDGSDSTSRMTSSLAESPGLVNWHTGGFEEAKAASRASGRPVLLFELLGDLDEVFC